MIKETQLSSPKKTYEEIPSFPRPGGMLKLNRNVAFLMLLLVCIASIHNQQLPDGQTVMTAVQGAVDEKWDDSLGKITFVDALVPETLSVFLQPETTYELTLPCSGQVVHSWEKNAPYLSFDMQSKDVFAVEKGEVMSLSPDAAGCISLRIRHDDGLESVYYHLASAALREGDVVQAGQMIGTAADSQHLVLDVRRNGLSIDPTAYFPQSAP